MNYYDWKPGSTTPGNGTGTVEEKMEATVVISTPAGDKVPSKMVAVLNPSKITSLGSESLDLYALRSIKQDWAALTSQENGFVMMNSVYASAASERVSTSSISAENLCETADDALDHPVEVYVERNVAKVSLGYKNVTLDDNGLYRLKDSEGNYLSVNNGTEDVDVYVKPLCWTLTATTSVANLSKHINPTWKTDLLSPEPLWSTPDYHRSFWAVNCLANANGTSGTDESGYNYYSFNEIKNADKSIDGTSVVYTNENAASDYNTALQREYPTQVIALAQLTDKSGKALEVVEFAGNKYVGAENLKKAMLVMVDDLYSGTYDEEKKETKYTKISPADITFESEGTYNTSILGTQDNAGGRYYVRAILSTDGAAKTWYTQDGDEMKQIGNDDVNKALIGIGQGKLWNTGYTYYYFKVQHLAYEDAGKYGVVRNHSYKCSITDITGFGTPVYNLDEKIYPETPVDKNTYIAAEINVLQWRVVTSSVNLGKDE